MQHLDQLVSGDNPDGMPGPVDTAGGGDIEWQFLLQDAHPTGGNDGADQLLEATPPVTETGIADVDFAKPLPDRFLMPDLNPYGLTEKQLSFCYHYAITGNGSAAAAYAGYEGAGSVASKILDIDRVKKQIAKFRDQARVMTAPEKPLPAPEVTQAEIWNELWAIGSVDAADAFEFKDGTMEVKRLVDMPVKVRKAIKQIVIEKSGRVNVQFFDKLAALQQLDKSIDKFNSKRGLLPGGGIPAAPQSRNMKDVTPDGDAAEAVPSEEIIPPQPTAMTIEQLLRANADRFRPESVNG